MLLLRADHGPTFTQHNDHADASTQSLTFMVLRLSLVLVSGPIAALAAASPQRLQFLGGARQALAVDARRVRKDVRGP